MTTDDVTLADTMAYQRCNECGHITRWPDWERPPKRCEHCGEPFTHEVDDDD